MRISTTAFLVVVGFVIGLVGVNNASAALKHQSTVKVATTEIAQQSSVPMGYCGSAFTSKSGAVSYYKIHPADNLETYVRAYAGYYHIQPDQSFSSWLDQPNVKVFPAPAGYKIDTNTYCKPDGTVAPYNGRYDVGKVMMMWWCTDARGYNCTPIAKGYCQNMVTGKAIKPVPKPVAKPTPKPAPTTKAVKPVGKTPPAAITAKCSVVIVGNNNKVAATLCNQYVITNVCGNQTVVGPSSAGVIKVAAKYAAAKCPGTKVPSPAKVVPPKAAVTPGTGVLVITKATPGVARACFRFHLWVWRGSAWVRSTDFGLCTGQTQTLSLRDGATVSVTESGAKGWATAPPCTRQIVASNTARCDIVNQQAAVATAAGFIATVSKKVMNSAMTADFTSFYKQYRLPVAVYVNGQKAFDIVVPMNGDTHAVSKDSKTPFVFAEGDTVKLCENLGFARGLVLEPVSPVGADGCLAAIKGIAGVVSFAFIDRAVESARQPTTVVPATSATPSMPPPPATCPAGTVGAPPICFPPPTVSLTLPGPGHGFTVNGSGQICATIGVAVGHGVTVVFAATGTTSPVYQVDSQTRCVWYTAPATAGTETLSVRVTDTNTGLFAIDSGQFVIASYGF